MTAEGPRADYLMFPDCVFCRIIRREAPAEIVAEWTDAIAIKPLDPVTDGHVLVLPKTHAMDALDDYVITARTMRRAVEIAPWPCNLITSAGPQATQTVFHLHIHIVPRSEDDGLPLPWTPQQEAAHG